MIDLLQFERDGFTISPSLLCSRQIAELITSIEDHAAPDERRGGVRDIMQLVPSLRDVADAVEVREVITRILGQDAIVVRSTLFDKTGAANWKVPWHQDVTIAVKERRDVEGYGPWSNKEGRTHVQPPTAILQKMLTIRIHLDACPASNGALRVMPGSHHLGRINQNDAPNFVREEDAVYCEAAAGEALIMRPLLLHASSPSSNPSHRRVLHFDYALAQLPSGLEWSLR